MKQTFYSPALRKKTDRLSAVEAIKRLNEEGLRFLNNLIVKRLKLISQTRTTSLMTTSPKAIASPFQPRMAGQSKAPHAASQQKTVSTVTDDGHHWNISPSLLRL